MITGKNSSENNFSPLIEAAKVSAKSPLEFQARLMEILCMTLVSSHSALAEAMNPDEMMRDIAAFHEKFGLSYAGSPRTLDPELADFRIKFMESELTEYTEACINGDLEKQFDALIDIVYVALGTAYLQGLPFRKGWKRVQAANMAKVRKVHAEDGHEDSGRPAKYDIVKPAGWMPPQHHDLVGLPFPTVAEPIATVAEPTPTAQ